MKKIFALSVLILAFAASAHAQYYRVAATFFAGEFSGLGFKFNGGRVDEYGAWDKHKRYSHALEVRAGFSGLFYQVPHPLGTYEEAKTIQARYLFQLRTSDIKRAKSMKRFCFGVGAEYGSRDFKINDIVTTMTYTSIQFPLVFELFFPHKDHRARTSLFLEGTPYMEVKPEKFLFATGGAGLRFHI